MTLYVDIPCIYICIYVYMGITCFTAPTQCFQVTKYSMCARFRDVVLVSEMLCMFPSSCARFTEVVHVSQKLCTFHKLPNNSCVQHTERILISKSIGATKHVLPIYIYVYICIYTCIDTYIQV